MNKGTFEARVIRENKSARGIFITLEVAADDYYAARLNELRPNALLMLAYDETLDVSVQPIWPSGDGAPPSSSPVTAAPQGGSTTAATSPKERKRFADLPLSQQAGIRCSDSAFQAFLRHSFPATITASEDYADAVRSLCMVKSRAEFDSDPAAAGRWRNLDEVFQLMITTKAHSETYR